VTLAIVTYVGGSRAASDPWALYQGNLKDLLGIPPNQRLFQSTAATELGHLWTQTMASVGDEPQPIGSITDAESMTSPVLRSTETESRRRAEQAIHLLDEWMADESGYDEETWPELKMALDRDRLSSRRFFDE
jgi:hypothetical protein